MPLEKIKSGGIPEDGDTILELDLERREEKIKVLDSFLMAAMVEGFKLLCLVENYQRFKVLESLFQFDLSYF